jgi:hypothetical protein
MGRDMGTALVNLDKDVDVHEEMFTRGWSDGALSPLRIICRYCASYLVVTVHDMHMTQYVV